MDPTEVPEQNSKKKSLVKSNESRAQLEKLATRRNNNTTRTVENSGEGGRVDEGTVARSAQEDDEGPYARGGSALSDVMCVREVVATENGVLHPSCY